MSIRKLSSPVAASFLVACGPHAGTKPEKYTGPVPDILTTELTCPADAEIDGAYIYAATGPLEPGKTGSIVRIPLGGGEPQVIAKDQVEPGAIALTDGEIWWVTHSLSEGGELRRASKLANNTAGTLVATGLVKPLAVLVDHDGYAFWGGGSGVWVHAPGAPPGTNVQRYDKATTRALVLDDVDGFVVAGDAESTMQSATQVRADRGGQKFERFEYRGSNGYLRTQFMVKNSAWYVWLAVNGGPEDTIAGNEIYNMDPDSMWFLGPKLVDGLGAALAVDENYAYCLDDRRLFTVQLRTIHKTVHDLVPDTGTPSHHQPALLLVDDHHVYWSQCGTGELHATPVPLPPESEDAGFP